VAGLGAAAGGFALWKLFGRAEAVPGGLGAPAISFPADGQTLEFTGAPITFSWGPVSGAGAYDWEVGVGGDFAGGGQPAVKYNGQTSSTSFSFMQTIPGVHVPIGSHLSYLQVRARGGVVVGPWGAVTFIMVAL